MIAELLVPVAVIGGLSLVFGLALGCFGKIFFVKEDERAQAVRDALSGANCGACGYPGCDGFAQAVAKGEAAITACPVGGETLVRQLSEIMGIEAEIDTKSTAFVRCAGDLIHAQNQYQYDGIPDCNAAALLVNGGAKACFYGCLGFGTCAQACSFGAIDMRDGLAVVDPGKCVACTLCVSTCPRNLIELIPSNQNMHVVCASTEPGRVVRTVCAIGCIACKICEKVCAQDAITMEDNLPKWDYGKCVHCGTCAEKCPKQVIRPIDAVKGE